MKLTCKRPSFYETFQLAANVASSKAIKSVLQNVKIEAGKGRVQLVASDYDIAVRLQAEDVEVERPGEVLLPAGRVAAILREIPDDEVRLDVSDGACLICGQHAEFRILCDTSEDFPDVASFEGEGTFEIKRDDLKDMTLDGVIAFHRKVKGGQPRWGLADRTGTVLVPPTWDFIGLRGSRYLNNKPFTRFVSGLMTVMTRDAAGTEKWGVIDRSGRVVVPLTWEAVVLVGSRIWVKRAGLWGLVDRAGKPLVPPRYKDISQVDNRGDHVHRVPVVTIQKKTGKQSCSLNAANKEVLCGFDGITYVGGPLLRVRKGKHGVLHSARTGARILPQALHADSPTCLGSAQDKAGLYPVAVRGPAGARLVGLVGEKGAATPFHYSTLGCFRFGRAPYTIVRKKAKDPLR